MDSGSGGRSVVSLKPVLIYASFFGLAPWYDFKKQELLHPKLSRCYIFFLAVAVTILSLDVLVWRYKLRYPYEVSLYIVEDVTMEMAGLSFFLITVLRTSLWDTDYWKKLFRKLQKTENKIVSNYIGKAGYFKVKNMYAFFVLGNLYLVILFSSDFGSYGKDNINTFLFSSTLIFRYTEFITAYIIVTIGIVIKCRYQEINWICSKKCKIVQVNFVKTLEDVRGLYLDLIKVTRIFSKLFGWPLLMIYFYTVVQVLNCLSFFVRETHFSYKSVLWVHLFYATEIMIWLTAIIFCCDSVMAEADDLLLNCYKLEQTLPLPSKELEILESLKNLIKNKSPKMTAAGFFEIRRSTLLSLLSTTTTYFIVALQFNALK